MPKSSAMKQRDPLLDLWRGLALVDMAWVHLAAYPIGIADGLALWISEYTRFAAGAFVFISGLSVARVFGPRLFGNPDEASATRRRLLRRALTLLVLDRLVAVAFGLIERSLSVPPTVTPHYPNLLDLLTFGEPGVTGGLLALYAILLTVTPLLEGLLRRNGWLTVLAASTGLFALAHLGGLGSHGKIWPFPVAYWQVLFVAGYVVSRRLSGLRDPADGIARWWLLLVSVAFGVLFLLRNGAHLGLAVAFALSAFTFVKVPLSPAELAWYLTASAFVLTWSAWLWEQVGWVRRLFGWFPLLGRQSLLVYVAHLFVQLAMIEALTLLEPTTSSRLWMLPLMALILTAVAAAGERWARATSLRSSWSLPPLRLLPSPAILGGAVMAGTFGVVMSMQLLFGTPATWKPAPATDGQMAVATTDDGAGLFPSIDDDPLLEQFPWPLEWDIDGYPGSSLGPESFDPEAIGPGA